MISFCFTFLLQFKNWIYIFTICESLDFQWRQWISLQIIFTSSWQQFSPSNFDLSQFISLNYRRKGIQCHWSKNWQLSTPVVVNLTNFGLIFSVFWRMLMNTLARFLVQLYFFNTLLSNALPTFSNEFCKHLNFIDLYLL